MLLALPLQYGALLAAEGDAVEVVQGDDEVINLDADEQQIAAELDALLEYYGEAIDIGEAELLVEYSLEQVVSDIRAITVLKAEELTGSVSLADALERVPGLDVRQGGGLGQLANLQLRGSRANQVLVLIDGQRLSAAETADLSALPLGAVERIEVLRGPEAARFGQGALGGVVNLITARPPSSDQPAEHNEDLLPLKEQLALQHDYTAAADSAAVSSLSLMAGGHSAAELSFSHTQPGESYFFSHMQARNNYSFQRSGTEREIRRNNEAVHDSLWAAWDAGDISHRAGFSHRRRGLPGSSEFPTLLARFAQDSLWWQGTNAAGSASFLFERTHVTDPAPYLSGEAINSRDTRISTSIAGGALGTLSAEPGWRLRLDSIDSSTAGSHQRIGADLQQSWQEQRGEYQLNLDVGLIASSDMSIDPAVRGGISKSLGDSARLYASAGYSVRHPDFGELYLTDSGSVQGNSELAAESVLAAELGASFNSGATRVETALFYSDYRESIIFAPVSAYLVRAMNTGPAKVAGLEALVDSRLSERLWWRTAYTWLPLAEFDSGLPLTGRAAQHLNSRLEYSRRAYTGVLSLDYSGTMTADLFGNLRIKPRAIVGLELSRDCGSSELGLSVLNLFDKSARDSWNYPLPGREYYLQWRMDL